MPNTLVRIPEVRVYPGVPAIAPQPKYCWQEIVGYEEVGGLSSGSSDSTVDYVPYIPPVPGEGDGNSLDADESSGGGTVAYGNYALSAPVAGGGNYVEQKPLYKTYCDPAQDIPGVPGRPPRVVENFGPDWRSHARSRKPLMGPGLAKFTVTGDAIVGFNPNTGVGGKRSLLPSNIVYGFQFLGGEVFEVANGVTNPTAIGTAQAGDVYYVYREPAHMRLRRDRGGTVTDLSSEPTETSDPQFLTAFLYEETSTVDSPQLQALSVLGASGSAALPMTAPSVTPRLRARPSGTASLPLSAVVATKRNGAWLGLGTGFLPLSTVVSPRLKAQTAGTASLPLSTVGGETIRFGDGVRQAAPAMAMNAGNSKAAMVALYPSAMTLEASGPAAVLAPEVSGAELYPNGMAMKATSLSGTIGGVDVEASKQRFFVADYDYATAELYPSKQRMFATDPIFLPGEYGYIEAIGTRSSFATSFSIAVSVEDSVEFETEASFLLLLEDGFEDTLDFQSELSLEAILLAAIESGLTFMEVGTPAYTEAVQYAYNVASQAVARIEGMNFDSMVRAGDYTYGIRKDGVFIIRPGSDNGAELSAVVDYGQTMFGSSTKKHVEQAFIGMSTDGTVYLKLTADDRQEKVYKAIQRKPTMKVRTGRGITAREWGVKLQVVNATAAELDTVEFVLATSARRWVR